MILLIISLLSVVVFARPPAKVCCENPSSCVVWDRCVASYTQYDVDGDGDTDYCEGGTGGDSGYWWDCWDPGESAACGDIDVGTHGVPNIKAQYCGAGHDCYLKIDSLCGTCTKNYECGDGLFCDGGYCKEAFTEAGLCSDGRDNDCDWTLDCGDEFTGPDDDCDCCEDEGGSYSVDSDCCGAMPCDNPAEAGSTKCGCPDPLEWDYFTDKCEYPEGALCSEVPDDPEIDCGANPLQTACLRLDYPSPFAPTQACCFDVEYDGTKYYNWDDAHITTY